MKKKEQNSNDSSNKKKKFISHKNNLSLNMTNERENILKNLAKKMRMKIIMKKKI